MLRTRSIEKRILRAYKLVELILEVEVVAEGSYIDWEEAGCIACCGTIKINVIVRRQSRFFGSL